MSFFDWLLNRLAEHVQNLFAGHVGEVMADEVLHDLVHCTLLELSTVLLRPPQRSDHASVDVLLSCRDQNHLNSGVEMDFLYFLFVELNG